MSEVLERIIPAKAQEVTAATAQRRSTSIRRATEAAAASQRVARRGERGGATLYPDSRG